MFDKNDEEVFEVFEEKTRLQTAHLRDIEGHRRLLVEKDGAEIICSILLDIRDMKNFLNALEIIYGLLRSNSLYSPTNF